MYYLALHLQRLCMKFSCFLASFCTQVNPSRQKDIWPAGTVWRILSGCQCILYANLVTETTFPSIRQDTIELSVEVYSSGKKA